MHLLQRLQQEALCALHHEALPTQNSVAHLSTASPVISSFFLVQPIMPLQQVDDPSMHAAKLEAGMLLSLKQACC
jgi:hypothetical protein